MGGVSERGVSPRRDAEDTGSGAIIKKRSAAYVERVNETTTARVCGWHDLRPFTSTDGLPFCFTFRTRPLRQGRRDHSSEPFTF